MKRILFGFLILCAAAGQSGLDHPSLGWMLDRGGVRPVFGLPGSLTVADPVTSAALSLGCASFCLIKTDSSLISGDQNVDSPAGPALFAFDSAGAFVYFPDGKQLARWQDGRLTPAPWEVAGEILSIRSVGGEPEFAVAIGGSIRIVKNGNAVLDTLPRGTQHVFLLDDGELFSSAGVVVWRRADGSELHFPLDRAQSFLAMSPDYVEIRAAHGIFALRLTPGREQLFELPELQP